MSREIKKEILKRLKFFRYFHYFPLEKELYRFLRIKIKKTEYKKILKELEKEKKIKKLKINGKRIVLGDVNFKKVKPKFSFRIKEYQKKISSSRFKYYIKILKLFPQIKFIGLSGSLAWGTSGRKDDIDLFIITKKNRLWTGRFIAVFLALILRIKRKRGEKKAPGKVCLNLFFDEACLKVPKIKQNEYVAFELLALKKIVDKGVYKRLLKENKKFILSYFPNFSLKDIKEDNVDGNLGKRNSFFKFLGDFVEKIVKSFQLFLINRHRTDEFITSFQLWFFPKDFKTKYESLIRKV